MFLALREIRRARWRFVLLTGAVGLLVFLILFVQALTGALIGQFIGAIDHQSADVLVYSAQARKNLEGSVVPPATVDAVAKVPGVARAGPLGEGTFSVRAGGKLRDAVLIGYELGGAGRADDADRGSAAGRRRSRPSRARATPARGSPSATRFGSNAVAGADHGRRARP